MNQKGQTTVETAISIILLFLLVFGITEFGRAMYIKNMLNNAARAAARAAVVKPALADLTYSAGSFNAGCTGITDPIQQKICDSLFYVGDKSNVSASVDVVGKSGGQTATSSDTVTVQVTLTGFTSFVPKLIKIGNTLIGSASMRYE